MPHSKGSQQSTRKNPREEAGKEDEFELEVDPNAREDTFSPSYSASSAGTASSGSTVSSSQLEMILAANSKILADSMASNQRSMEASQKSMESSILSVLSSISTSGSVAPTSAVASAPPPAPAPRAQVKVPTWSDAESPTTYFSKLEKAFTLNGVPRPQWGQSVHVHLTGEAQDALAQVPLASLEDYDVIKATVLDALGDTPEHADRDWWSLHRKSGEDACAFYLRIRACGILRLQGLMSKDEILEKLVLSRFLSLLPANSYEHAADRSPKDGLAAAKIVQQLEQRRAYTREMQGWRHHQSFRRREPSRNSYNGGGNSGSQGSNTQGGRSHSPTHSGKSSISSSGNSGDGTGSSNFFSGADASEGSSDNSDSGAPASGGFERNGGRGSRRPVTCHGCGEPGHIRPDCPNRIRSIRSPGSSPGIVVTGLIAGVPVKGLQIDTGAGRTVIDAKHIPRSAYLGRTITLDTWKGRQCSEYPLAKLSIRIKGVSTVAVVAVGENFGSPALLGLDLGPAMSAKLASIVADRTKAALHNISELEVPMQKVIVEPDEVLDVTVEPSSEIDSVSDSDVTAVPKQSEDTVVTMQHVEPDVVFETHELTNELESDQDSLEDDDTPVTLGDVFDFADTLFCDDSPVDLGDVFNFSDSLFDPEDPVPTPVPVLEVCPMDEAGSSYFGGDCSEVEKDCVAVRPLDDLFDVSNSSDGYDSLVGLGDDLDLVDQPFVPSPVKILEVPPVGGTDIECPLPVLDEVVVAWREEAYVAPVVEVAVEQFAVVESLGGEAPVPVINNFKFSDEFFDLADHFFEQEPVLSPDPVMQLMPAEAFIHLTLTEEVPLSTSCCQSYDLAILLKYFLRFQTKATRRLAPGRDSVSTLLLCFSLRIRLLVLFCCSTILLVLVQVSSQSHRRCFWTTLPAGCQKLLLPMRVLSSLYPCLRQQKGGEMLWSLSPQQQQTPNIELACQLIISTFDLAH